LNPKKKYHYQRDQREGWPLLTVEIIRQMGTQGVL